MSRANQEKVSKSIQQQHKTSPSEKAMEKRGRMKLYIPPMRLGKWVETDENQRIMHELRAA
jgi:hypothetical protein